MDDEVVRATGHQLRREMQTPHITLSSKGLSSVDDQIDSGLESIGYYSSELSLSSNVTEPERVGGEVAEESANISSNPLTSLENSISGLRISTTCASKALDQCDSGLDDDKTSQLSDSISTQDVSLWVSPNFSPEQILDIFRGDEDGDNHLHLSIIHGLPEVTMQIIGLAPHWDWLNQTNNLLQTPLHIAVITRQIPVIRRLICAGAFVDLRDQMGNTPLHNACRLGFEDVVRTLIRPVEYKECYQNRYSIPFQRLPQDLESMNYEGLTCLHLAAIGGHVDVIRLLLDTGANVNAAEGKSGRTVLHFAADWGNMTMIKFLLSRKDTDVNARTYAGLTPFHLALGRQNQEVMNELEKKGALCETLSLSEESDSDFSDEEMVEDLLPNRLYGGLSQRSFLQGFRNVNVQSY